MSRPVETLWTTEMVERHRIGNTKITAHLAENEHPKSLETESSYRKESYLMVGVYEEWMTATKTKPELCDHQTIRVPRRKTPSGSLIAHPTI